MKKINKGTREKSKRGGCLKWFGIVFVGLMLMASFGGGGSTEGSDTTTTTDNDTEEVSSEVEESVQAEESLVEEREAKEEEERSAKEKEEEERLEQESIEAEEEEEEEEWQEELDNARTDVTYDNLMRTPDDYFGQVVQLSGTVLQTINGDGVVQQRVALYDDYDQIILIEYSEDLPEVRLLDDDYITFTGVSLGTIEYETVLGATLEIPSILVDRINIG